MTVDRSIPRESWQVEYEAERLERRARLLELVHRFKGEPDTLLPFHKALALRPREEHHLGLRSIQVDRVVGSVDRYEDFHRHFLPRTPHTLERWKRLRALQLSGVEFPPIEVYQVGEAYFVKDGHHRVALAKATGQKFIDAYVIALGVPVPVEPGDTVKDLILKAEYADFLIKTRLKELIPPEEFFEIRFTTLGRYDLLLDHIATRRYFKGLEEGREVPWEEAVKDWYRNLYRPTVEAIRQLGLLKDFSGRTEADLYLWVMDHRYFLALELGVEPAPLEAARSYEAQFGPWWKRLGGWLKGFYLATGQGGGGRG
ncbi:transcriptional regulator [Thermus neutrinimicus]|uniref:transcriptional regulator n=1 Tax=Thermus neutrinimicus TaxID=2908149 RepID=UPI001FA9CF84|nr:transcriptional regulator [Thermus neutrinimicus]